MSKQSLKCVSKFIIPAYTDNIIKLLKDIDGNNGWNRSIKGNADGDMAALIQPRYLSACVDLHFAEKKNRDISVYELTEAGFIKNNIPKKECLINMRSYVKKGTGKPETFSFSVKSVSLWVFSTGMMFYVIETLYPTDYDIEQITDFSFNFTRLLTKQDELRFEIAETEEKIDFCDNLRKLIGNERIVLISEDDGMFGYHAFSRKVSSLDEVEWKNYAKALSRGLPSNAQIGKSNIFDRSMDYQQTEGVYWFGDSFSLVSYSEYVPSGDFDYVPTHYKNVNRDYFLLYLLSIHSREFLTYINMKMVELNDKYKELLKLRKKIIMFEALFSHKNVSKHSTYQYYYDSLMDLYNIDELSSDIKGSLIQIEEYIKEKGVREQKVFTGLISLFGLIGIINNMFYLVNNVSAGLKTWHLVGLIILAALLVVSIVYGLKQHFDKRV